MLHQMCPFCRCRPAGPAHLLVYQSSGVDDGVVQTCSGVGTEAYTYAGSVLRRIELQTAQGDQFEQLLSPDAMRYSSALRFHTKMLPVQAGKEGSASMCR